MDRNFFARNPVRVAEQLIGCKLVRRTGQGIIRVRITETEAYRGADDPASHAHRGPTPRNTLMFGTPGHLYVHSPLIRLSLTCPSILIFSKRFCIEAILPIHSAQLACSRTVPARQENPCNGTNHSCSEQWR